MNTYQQYIAGNGTQVNACTTVGVSPSSSFVFDVNNPSYRQFKLDLMAGAALNDPTGKALSTAQINTFMSTLP